MSAGALPGFRDFYPTELAERNHLFGVWRDVARRFGFVEYDGPPLEPLELYTRKSGDEIVAQLYSFTDKGGRQVALRPEMTPTFARMVAAKANALRKPVRWFSIPQLFRYERQQKGRLREHFQLNVDIVGETDVAADAELLAVAVEIMRACGLTPGDVVARVSDRQLLGGLLRAWRVPDESVSETYAAIDKLEREPRATLVDRLTKAGIDSSVAAHILEAAATSHLPSLRSELEADVEMAAVLDRLERYLALLRSHGVEEWIKFDLAIVRGLAYYTGIVFELFDRRGEFRAICGGGRYDNLLKDLGGVDLPALGFGMGDVVLSALLHARGRLEGATPGIDFFVVADKDVTAADVVEAAAGLRRLGFSVEYVLSESKMTTQKASKQLETADKVGAEHALFLSSGRTADVRFLRRAEAQKPVNLERLKRAASADEYLKIGSEFATDWAVAEGDALSAILRRKRERSVSVTDRP
jgi:histidyl-tRNA synthetase